MESRDLRIGNYLIIDGVLVRVRSVYSFTNGSFKNNEGRVEAYRYDSIFEPKKISAGINRFEPIPLTEEWLVKFGFNFSGYNNEDKALYKIDDEVWIVKNIVTKQFYLNEYQLEIKHVHQLQNLYFALTNEELTIKK
jgi:hypothetical protein